MPTYPSYAYSPDGKLCWQMRTSQGRAKRRFGTEPRLDQYRCLPPAQRDDIHRLGQAVREKLVALESVLVFDLPTHVPNGEGDTQ